MQSVDAEVKPKKDPKVTKDDTQRNLPVVILAFDDDGLADLKNPFAKKPSLASRHKSLIEQKKTPEPKKSAQQIPTPA